jgi:hypothetical protein
MKTTNVQIMKSYILLLVGLFISIQTFAQKNNGYYGKKFFIDVEGLGNLPLISNIFSDAQYGYKAIGKTFILQKDNFNTGFRLNLGYAVKRNFGLSFEFGQDYSSVSMDNDEPLYLAQYENVYVKHEMLDVKTTVFIPKLEFTTSKALLPMGLSHQIGFGVANSRVAEKDYLYQYFDYSGITYPTTLYSTSTADIDPVNFEKFKTVKKFVLLYALNMRTPITKSLMFNYGIKYTLNIGKTPNDYYYGNDWKLSYTRSVENTIAKHRTFSFMNAYIGLTFVF